MHTIEPFYRWESLYSAADDERSPFYGREYAVDHCTDTIYNFYIHPEWDFIGSETLYIKILYADYAFGGAILELMGEWNDALHNDIMHLKRNVTDLMDAAGIKKYILIGENVLNFHGSDDCYYEEWFEDTEDGWIAAIGFREHVTSEWREFNVDAYLNYGGRLEVENWRTFSPLKLLQYIDNEIVRRLA